LTGGERAAAFANAASGGVRDQCRGANCRRYRPAWRRSGATSGPSSRRARRYHPSSIFRARRQVPKPWPGDGGYVANPVGRSRRGAPAASPRAPCDGPDWASGRSSPLEAPCRFRSSLERRPRRPGVECAQTRTESAGPCR
jgi:hypothetical protein